VSTSWEDRCGERRGGGLVLARDNADVESCSVVDRLVIGLISRISLAQRTRMDGLMTHLIRLALSLSSREERRRCWYRNRRGSTCHGPDLTNLARTTRMDGLNGLISCHISLSLLERRGVPLLQAFLVDGLRYTRHIMYVPASKSNATLVWVSKRENSRETHLQNATLPGRMNSVDGL
jgi:hypothetical protein